MFNKKSYIKYFCNITLFALIAVQVYASAYHSDVNSIEEESQNQNPPEPRGNEPFGPEEEESGDEEPGGEEPGDEEPGDEEPGDEEPGGEEPGDEEPGDEKPGDKEPGEEEPGEEEPGEEQPTDSVAKKVRYALLITQHGYDPVSLIVDPELKLKVVDGQLVATQSNEETDPLTFELSNISKMQYLPFIEKEPDTTTEVKSVKACPEFSLSPYEITIRNPFDKIIHCYIYRIDGSLMDDFEVEDNLSISLESYPKGIYILSGENLANIKFIIR